MSQLLNTKFQAVTGKGLGPENLNYLASKVFGKHKFSPKIIQTNFVLKVVFLLMTTVRLDVILLFML